MTKAATPTQNPYGTLSTAEVTLRRDNILAAVPYAEDDAHRQELLASAARMTAETARRANA